MELIKYKDKESNKDELAVSLWALYHNINLLDAKHQCDPAKTLAELKYNIMQHLEIIVVDEKKDEDVEDDKAKEEKK